LILPRAADLSILVLVPGMGDEVQTLKAGIMEIGDIFALNKSDRPGAAELRRQVEFFLSMVNPKDGRQPSIVQTTAVSGQGIEELHRCILNFRDQHWNSQSRWRKKREAARARLLELLGERLIERLLGDEESAAVSRAGSVPSWSGVSMYSARSKGSWHIHGHLKSQTGVLPRGLQKEATKGMIGGLLIWQ